MSKTARGAKVHRRCFGTPSRGKKKQPTRAPQPLTAKCGQRDGSEGRNNLREAAVVAAVSVALPVSDAALSVMVFGAVKLEPGAPKLQVGKTNACAGSVATTALRVIVPPKPSAPVSRMTVPRLTWITNCN